MSEQNNSVADAALAALKALQKEIQETVLDSRESVDEYRIRFLSRKQGQVTALLKRIPEVAAEHRKQFGQEINAAKSLVESRIEQASSSFSGDATSGPELDFTLPGREVAEGSLHPITHALRLITKVFESYGFAVAEGPEAEDDWHNFTALNIPPDHPARQEHDTFYLPGEQDGERMVLRTHTSPVQIRTMQNGEPPFRIIVPGRTYRCDYDATHSPMFHQVEGLLIDEAIHMGHLKGCLIEFCRAFFDMDDLPVRFRASYFPFTEPSAEVDIGCTREGGQFRIGHGDDWLEILGCGMVNPKVLENCGIDPVKYQGFAFGMGVERLAMLKYGIPDLRTFYETDLRWLKHYGFSALDMPSMVGGLNR